MELNVFTNAAGPYFDDSGPLILITEILNEINLGIVTQKIWEKGKSLNPWKQIVPEKHKRMATNVTRHPESSLLTTVNERKKRTLMT